MSKDICYDSMSSIIEDFKIAYEESDHTILKLQIGLPVEHNIMSSTYICWELVCLCPADQPWPECVAAIENHASRMKHLWNVWVISGRGADPTRKLLKVLRKPPQNNGLNTRVKPKVKKASTLRKSSVGTNRSEVYQVPPCRRPTSTYTRSYQSTVTNKTHFWNSHNQRSAPVSINKSLLKGFFNPRDSTGPWNYTQCPKHRHQGTMCGENEEYSVIHIDEYRSMERNPLAWEDCRHCDCGNLLCQAGSKLLDENRKIRGSGPLYSMLLQKPKTE